MSSKSPDEKPTSKGATIEDIRNIEGNEHLSDEEAGEILSCIQQYVHMVAEFAYKKLSA